MPKLLTNTPGFQVTPVHWLWLGLVVLSTALQLAGWMPAWRYERALVSDSHWWLMFSGQLVHKDWGHWALNMAGVGIVMLFFSAYDRLWHWLLVFVISAACVGVGVHLYNPEVLRFVGLSGILHGLFIYGAIRETSRYPLSGYVLLAILVAKLAYEYFVGAMPFSEEMSGGRVITDSHLYGAIGGALAFITVRSAASLARALSR